MSDLRQYHTPRTPPKVTALMWLLVGVSVLLFGVGTFSLVFGPVLRTTDQLGQQGDFFGGHLAAVVGSLTLAIVVYTSFHQSRQQERFFMRQYFMQGIDLIAASLHDQDSLRALRIVEYYSRLALSGEDGELFLVLNTVLSGDLRKQLEKPDSNTTNNYPFSVSAVQHIRDILKESALKRKGLR